MELIDYITDLLIDFDEMGFAPTTLCPSPEAYAIEWRNKITKAFKELTEENEKLQKALNTDISIVRVSRGSGKTAHLREVGRIKADAIRADTVRKLLDRITKHATNGYPRKVRLDVVEKIAKEMFEGL